MEKTRDYTISSVKKALEILKLFDGRNTELTLSQLSEISGIGKSSMLRILYTLCNEDFIAYDAVTKKYSLGIELYRLGSAKYDSLDVRHIARQHLRILSDKTNMICYLGVREGDSLVMVDRILPTSIPIWAQLMVQNGGTMALYSTGIGRLFLAQDSDEQVEAYLNRVELKKYTDATIVDKKTLLELVRQARADQYSYNIGENEPYIHGLCAPVYGRSRHMEAGVSLCGMKDVLCGPKHDEYLRMIRRTALDISHEIGYSAQD